MDKDWERIYKKMLLNSTYGVSDNPEMVSEIRKKIENMVRSLQRDKKIKKLLD